MQNEEGGVVEEEFRVAYVVDRVTTFGTAFLGLTFECSRCHDHKFDPITQKDFYSLFAFFQNIDESGQTTYFTGRHAGADAAALDRRAGHEARRAGERRSRTKEGRLAAARAKAARPAFEAWLANAAEGAAELPGLVAALLVRRVEGQPGRRTRADAKKPGKRARRAEARRRARSGRRVELTGENGFTFPGVGHFTRTDPFTLSLWLKPPTHAPRAVVVHHSQAPIDAGSRGYELLLENGRVAFGLHHMWPGNSLKVRDEEGDPGRHVGARHRHLRRVEPGGRRAGVPRRRAGRGGGGPRRAAEGHHLRRRRAEPGARLPVPRQRVQGRHGRRVPRLRPGADAAGGGPPRRADGRSAWNDRDGRAVRLLPRRGPRAGDEGRRRAAGRPAGAEPVRRTRSPR